MERAGLHVMFYYYSAYLHLGKTKDERKLQYSRSNILGFIDIGYFMSTIESTEFRADLKFD
jgi:hypothetical protein